MGEEKKSRSRQMVVLEDRESLRVTGVLEVLSFDEETVVCDTEQGILMMNGSGLHVSRLDLEEGELWVEGQVDAISYQAEGLGKTKGALLGRLFR